VLASSAVATIVQIVAELQKKGFAYEVDGRVFFDVSKISAYGAMCRMNQREMIDVSRERGADPDDPRKKNPLDFLLWVRADESPFWESPWGAGRPGWHIECSAMIYDRFGAQIDIHAGGADLIYPHHESEIAQIEGFSGASPFVGHWMHVAMVQYEGEKMSKSLGNLILVEDLLKTYSPNAVRYMLLSHYYRESWEYDVAQIEVANRHWSQLEQQLDRPDQGSFDDSTPLLSHDLQTNKVLELCHSMAGQPLRQTLSHMGFIL
jgi:L-cysteine:1D-myo-inositol 2-amino-2-deoxy-alpha-D-glucopyranoside ligase